MNKTLKRTVERAQNGNTRAFKTLFDSLSDRLFAYTVSHTKNRDDALDIVQETFIDLWSALPTLEYRSDESFHGFVFIILKRKLYKTYEMSKKTISIEEIEMQYELQVNEDYRYLHKKIKILTPRYQELIKLRYWKGLPFQEIANVLDIPEATAKVWHHRAVQKLKGNVEKYDI